VTARILIVDDEKSIRFALDRYFSQQGYAVDVAADGADARLLVRHNDYALAIVDLHLDTAQSADGLDLAAWIRTQSPATAVIILTALGSPEVEARAAAVGVSSFLRKPMRLASVADVALGVIAQQRPSTVLAH
jgi:DNA-binding response OmpR family regulator